MATSTSSLEGWSNGSVGVLVSGISQTFDNLNLTIWNETSAGLTFDPTRTDFPTISSTVDALFQIDSFFYTPGCAYPISGQYGFLPRLLYYVLLVSCLVFHRHVWLSTAALGTAMTYGATSAVHAFALIARYKYTSADSFNEHTYAKDHITYFGDLDLAGIYPILAAGCIMLPPILNWSTTIRENDAQPILLYWGILMFAALVATLISIGKGGYVTPYQVYTQLATCAIDNTKGCTVDALSNSAINNKYSREFYAKCNCNDTCGAVSLDTAPYRKGTAMQAWLVKDQTITILSSNAFSVAYYVVLVALVLTICYGAVSMAESKWTQQQVREWVFRRLIGRNQYDRIQNSAQRDKEAVPDEATMNQYHHRRTGFLHFLDICHLFIAKCTAALIYVLAILMIFLSPMAFVMSVIINEILTHSYPVAELESAIGQWAPWISTGFVIAAAIICKFHHAWVISIRAAGSAIYRSALWLCGKRSFRLQANEHTRDNSIQIDVLAFVQECAQPLHYARDVVRRARRRIMDEWKDFWDWWKHPYRLPGNWIDQIKEERNGSLTIGPLQSKVPHVSEFIPPLSSLSETQIEMAPLISIYSPEPYRE